MMRISRADFDVEYMMKRASSAVKSLERLIFPG